MDVGPSLPPITDIQIARRTASGRVGELRIVFAHSDIRIASPDIRGVLRPDPDRLLGSLAFDLDVTRRDGQVVRLVATGTGWGHGVGLCQWGAVGRARAGQDVEKILASYFPGTNIAHLY
jgi:stage II sporulation protein D